MALELPRWKNWMVRPRPLRPVHASRLVLLSQRSRLSYQLSYARLLRQVLVTMVMTLLVVDIWFYYSKSLNCCKDIRAQLDRDSPGICPPNDFSAPCREFVGNCADTEEQFRSLPPDQGGLPEDYECHQVRSDAPAAFY